MPSFSGFAPFGLLSFDDAPSAAQTAYAALENALGPVAFVTDLTTYEGSKIFAFAILIGVTRGAIRRSYNQQIPLAVKDKIASLESDWGLIPGPLDDLNARQLALAAQELLMSGSRQEAIETALTALLGSDFYTLRVTTPSEHRNVPVIPTDQGTFDAVGVSPKLVRLLDPVVNTAVAPPPGSTNTVRYELIGESTDLIVGDMLTLDPSNANRTEAVEVSAVVPVAQWAVTATFAKLHAAGGAVLSGSKVFSLLYAVTTFGEQVVTLQAAIGGATPVVGDELTFDNDSPHTETVAATSVVDESYRTMTFNAENPHDVGIYGGNCLPMWRSNQRWVAVLVRPGSITPELARQVNALMARHMKSVTVWSIDASTPGGLTAPWIVADAIIGETALGDSAG